MSRERDPRIDDRWYERPPDMKVHDAAGGLVVRVGPEGEILAAFAREPGFETPVLPKGHVKERETAEAAARREIAEEAGFRRLHLLGELGTKERLNYRRTHWKVTRYFLYITDELDGDPSDERHPPPVWHPLDDHPDVFWPEQQALLEETRAEVERLVAAWRRRAAAG